MGGALYDFGIERSWVAKPFGRVVFRTDAGRIYESLRVVGDQPDGTAVLDVPCGGGLALRGVRAGQRLRYIAADISPTMLERARRMAERRGVKGVEYVEADIEALPFDDAEFDLCLCFNGLHCLPDPAAAVREIARCLKPGGRLVGDCAIRGVGLRQDVALLAMRTAGVFGPGGTFDDVGRWLTQAGLEPTRLERSGAVARFEAVRPAQAPP